MGLGAFPLINTIPAPAYQQYVRIGANAPQLPTIYLPPGITYDFILLYVSVAGYGGSDVVSIRFNGDTTAANYWDRTITAAQGGTTLTNTETESGGLIRMGLPTSKGRQVQCQIGNAPLKTKVVQILNQFGSGTATPATASISSQGEWLNATNPITQIDILTAGGANILAPSAALLQAWGPNQ